MTIGGESSEVAARPAKTWFGHPGGLLVLFLTEMWERFSFYGMRAMLTKFLVAGTALGGFAMAEEQAFQIYSVYNSMVYLMALPGGWVADRLLGTRRSVLWGGIVIALGHYALALPTRGLFFVGLILIVLGTGLLKPNISAMVGELYDKHKELPESKRDAGFTLFYMGINLGAFIAPLITGWVRQNAGYHWAFGVAAVGMTIAVIQYVLGWKRLEGVGRTAHKPATRPELNRLLKIAVLIVAAIVVVLVIDVAVGAFRTDHITSFLAFLPLVVAVGYFWMVFRDRTLSHVERSRVTAYVFIFLGATLFWMIYDQAGSVLTIFADEDTDRTLGGFEIPTEWFQSINAILILALAPFFAWLWVRLGTHNPTTSRKFSYALMGIGFSFFLMALATVSAGAQGLVSPWWLVGVYFIQTVAELLLSPVGLSVTTKLAPLRYASQIMGLWFLATACGNALNRWVAPLVNSMPEVAYFAVIGGLAVLMGLCFWIASRKLTSLMSGVH
ncbi:MAG TPA: peptide MFS transporter [Candidatus Limnocylindrales bacterium]